MKVLLLNPPYQPNFIRSARSTWPSISGSNWYPIFLAYATGWLAKNGHQVKLVDALVENLSFIQVIKLAKDWQPQLTVVYVADTSLKNDLEIGIKIKKVTNSSLILVGPWCAPNAEKILRQNPLVDGLVPHELEKVLLDLANQKDKKKIKGLVWQDKRKIISNPPADFLTTEELDDLPFVSQVYKNHLHLDLYYQASLLHPFVDLFTGRGCPWGKCSFCLWPHTIHQGAPYRPRSAENVLAELKFIREKLPEVKEVFFQDDTLPAWRAKELAQLILKNRLKITWSCYSRANLDLKTLKLMKKAGCRYLHVGYESADLNVLKLMCKGTSPAIMKKFTDDTKKAGLKVHGDFILGLPGETKQTIKQTIKWAKDLGIEGYQFFLPQPQEGTPLFAYLTQKGYLNKKGEINYPGLKYDQLCSWRFKAMRQIYFSPTYFLNTLKNIDSLADLLRLIRTGIHALPKML